MNVGIGTAAAQFLFWDFFFKLRYCVFAVYTVNTGIFIALWNIHKNLLVGATNYYATDLEKPVQQRYICISAISTD